MVELTDRRANLSDAKRALLQSRLSGQKRSAEPAAGEAAGSVGTTEPVLSSAQRRMWFFHELLPESAVYNVPFAVRISGVLNSVALAAAIKEVMMRHEVLRTCIEVVQGEPRPRRIAIGAAPLTETDLRTDATAETTLQALLNAECRRPFDLGREVMLRASLYRLRDDEYVLAVVLHHIASDLWSWRIFRRELQAFYIGFTTEQAAELPPLRLQYADYARAEQSSLVGAAVARQLVYWKRKLAGASVLLDLPTDSPRPETISFRGALMRHPLPSALVAAAKELGQREDATLFMTLLAVFQVLLSRLTRQSDIIVGVPTAGRAQPQTEELIGLFVNTLAVRTDVSADPSFQILLASVKDTVLEALSNQDVPFDKIIEELKPARAAGYLPLVQVMFTLQAGASDGMELPGLRFTSLEVDPGTARFDLTLVAEQKGDGIDLVMEYSTDLFEAATIRRMLGEFQTLLESVVDDAAKPVSRLPILTTEERRQLIVDWNRTQQDFAIEGGLHRLFEARADQHPQREALVAGTRRISYGELNERADALARHLRKLGVNRETRVAVFLTRDIEMIVTLLAILKAGGAYVAMDPAYPLERLAFILQDSGAALVATQRSLLPSLPPSSSKVVVVDELAGAGRELDPLFWVPKVQSGDLAYVIYTSGSTGRPKGVAIEHRNAIAFIRWAETVFTSRELSGVLAGTSICFDLSVFEIFVPLCTGGKVILAENPLALPALPAANEVVLINTVPSVMRQVLQLGLPPSVEIVNLAGEPLPADLVDQIYAKPHVRHVYDLYGPTETTTYSTFTRRVSGARATIGRPIANTELYVLDRHRELVPIGVAGELFIGGAGVARGYLDRPTLTTERFVPHPFSAHPEARLYRTGDLCRYRSDGNLEYLGRGDEQLKIRGFRIEPAEIESVLRVHPGVHDAVVVAVERDGDRRLVAYIEPNAGIRRERDMDFRAFLRRTLPEQMIPSAFITIAAIPRTANGKIDRGALAAAELVAAEGSRVHVAPRDLLEAQLAEIWERVLHTAPISVHDRFFDLGGHSLLAVRLVLEIEKVLDCQLPVAALFQAPSVAELAALMRAQGKAAPATLVAIQPKGSRPPLFLAHGMGGGNLWGYSNLAGELGDDQPVYAFKPCEPEQIAAFPTVESMAKHYVEELRRIQPNGPYRLGGYCFGGNIAYEMACQLEAAGERVCLLALMDAWPANRGHDRIHWSPRSAVKFIGNVGFWIGRWWRWPARTRVRFVVWKAQTAAKKILHLLGRETPKQGREVELLVDLKDVSAGERQLWQAHLRALNNFHPRPYRGPVALLRTKGYPFYSSFDHAHGWRELAGEKVAVHFVPGMHETIMVAPYVTSLAGELRKQLAVCGAQTE